MTELEAAGVIVVVWCSGLGLGALGWFVGAFSK